MKWILLLLLSLPAFGFDNPYLMRSPRGLLMGDAFTAVNDDENTLFYNPASMARHKRDFTLYPFNPQLSATNVLSDSNRFDNVGDDPVLSAETLLDYPVHAQAGIAPGFKFFNVGVNFIANQSYDLLLRNRTHPMLDLDLRSDKGLIVGIGVPVGPGRISGKSGMGSQTSFGVSAKYIERTGLSDSLALTGTTVLDTLSQSELDKIMRSLGKVRGIGWGFDAGLEHVERRGNSQFVAGLTALDITGTDFKIGNNPDKLKVANIRDQVNFGMAAGQDLKIFNYIFSADIRDLTTEMDFARRVRLGAQIGIPGVKLLFGINSGYYSYGAMLDLAFMKLTAGFYGEEVGSKYKQIESKRFVIYLSLFDFSFDA
jgi:hypothetical protein